MKFKKEPTLSESLNLGKTGKKKRKYTKRAKPEIEALKKTHVLLKTERKKLSREALLAFFDLMRAILADL